MAFLQIAAIFVFIVGTDAIIQQHAHPVSMAQSKTKEKIEKISFSQMSKQKLNDLKQKGGQRREWPGQEAPAPPAPELRPNAEGLTLRQWMSSQPCLNMAIQPLMNTQFAMIGAMDALHNETLLDRINAATGVSSGAFLAALASTKDYAAASKTFKEIWPGWGGLGEKDPELSQNYQRHVLAKVLPGTFEELRIPVALTATKYKDDWAALNIDSKQAEPVVISDGNLYESIIASSSAMIGPTCPKCHMGWSAKNFRGMWPVADGFLQDEYGTMGLHALPACPNLLHMQPQNKPQQLSPTPNDKLDTKPTNVVTLGIDVPSSAIMSLVPDLARKSRTGILMNMYGHLDQIFKTMGFNEDEEWEKLQHQTAFDHMKEMLDKPMLVGSEPNHYFVDLNLMEHWEPFRGTIEKMLDKVADADHGKYWTRTMERRMEMIDARNKAIREGSLSYKKGGNGLGAPQA